MANMPEIGETSANKMTYNHLLYFVGEMSNNALNVIASGILWAATPKKIDGMVPLLW